MGHTTEDMPWDVGHAHGPMGTMAWYTMVYTMSGKCMDEWEIRYVYCSRLPLVAVYVCNRMQKLRFGFYQQGCKR